VIAELFRSERSANTACNKIYKVHGWNLSVTDVNNCMRHHQRNGGHPSLRIVDVHVWVISIGNMLWWNFLLH
jgi:hypothetical protein